MRLAFDANMFGFAGQQLIYERFFGGDPILNAHRHVNGYDKQSLMDKARMLFQRTAANNEEMAQHAAE